MVGLRYPAATNELQVSHRLRAFIAFTTAALHLFATTVQHGCGGVARFCMPALITAWPPASRSNRGEPDPIISKGDDSEQIRSRVEECVCVDSANSYQFE